MYHLQKQSYQFRPHVLQLADEVSEELGHVFLLARVEGHLVHCIDFAEAARVVCLALAVHQVSKHFLEFHQRTLMLAARLTLKGKHFYLCCCGLDMMLMSSSKV